MISVEQRKSYSSQLFVIFVICSMFMTLLCSCNNAKESGNGDSGQEYDGVPLVILDTDIGSSTDDLFTMVMAYDYHKKGRCKLLGVVVDREGEDYAACADVMNTYYGFGDLPIALERNGVKNPPVFTDYRNLGRMVGDDGKPVYETLVRGYSDLPDGWELYRELLAEQPDHSVSICSLGFCTSLAQLLESKGDDLSPLTGVELVRQKVKCLYIMGGIFTSSEEPDYNFLMGGNSAQSLFSLWPKDVDVVFSPMEVGNEIEYLKEAVLADLEQAENHPVKYVYEELYNVNGGQKMWDPLVLIQAVEGDGEFALSPRGFVTLTPEAATIFKEDANGNSRYQKPGTKEWNTKILDKIRKASRSI